MEIFSSLLMGIGAGGANAGGTQTSIVPTLLTFGLIIVVFYFLIIRPQSKKQRETKRMLSELKRDDVVATIGGIHGTIHALKDQTVILRVDGTTKMEFSRSAIASVVKRAQEKEVESIPEKEEAPLQAAPAKKRSSRAKTSTPKKKTTESEN